MDLMVKPDEDMGIMSVLDRTGDSRIMWSKTDPDQVAAAEKRFDEYKAKGFAAFRVSKADGKGEQIDKFDASAERIIFVPQLQGG
jgi:hypothetical protein